MPETARKVERTKDLITEDVVVTRPVIGLLYMQVCAYGEVPPERVEAKANLLNPAGTSGGWHIILADDPDHDPSWPSQAPVPCQDDPTRIHYMLNC